MSNPAAKIFIPKEAIAEFDSVEKSDWSEGVSLEELVDWINWVAERFRPDELEESARTSHEFTTRSFRHYQTLGCIDKPERVGRKGVYRFRQYLQALVIRKLLWERVSSAQIVSLMEGCTNEELKRLLFEGIEIVPGNPPNKVEAPVTPRRGPEHWTRFELTSGVEVHLNEDLPRLSPEEIASLADSLKQFLESR